MKKFIAVLLVLLVLATAARGIPVGGKPTSSSPWHGDVGNRSRNNHQPRIALSFHQAQARNPGPGFRRAAAFLPLGRGKVLAIRH